MRVLVWVLLLVAPATVARPADELHFPAAPVRGEHVVDPAEALSPDDAGKIRAYCRDVLRDENEGKRALVVVVVLPSLAAHTGGASDGGDWTVGAFARALLTRWSDDQVRSVPAPAPSGDGPEGVEPAAPTARQPPPAPPAGYDRSLWKRAVLVLVAVEDRRVAVEIGPAWLHRLGAVSHLKLVLGAHLDREEVLGTGLVKGLVAVTNFLYSGHAAMPGGDLVAILLSVFVPLLLLSLMSYLRKGRDSLAYRVWTAVFSSVGVVITTLLSAGVDLSARITSDDEELKESQRLVLTRW